MREKTDRIPICITGKFSSHTSSLDDSTSTLETLFGDVIIAMIDSKANVFGQIDVWAMLGWWFHTVR